MPLWGLRRNARLAAHELDRADTLDIELRARHDWANRADGLDRETASQALGKAQMTLFLTCMEWALSLDARIRTAPSIWRGQTRQTGTQGPYSVRINGHDQAIEGIKGNHILIETVEAHPRVIAMLSDKEEQLLGSHPGESEAGLLAHFQKQPSMMFGA